MVHLVAEADERSSFGKNAGEVFYVRHGIVHSSSTFINPRGLRIFTQRWVPVGDAPVLSAITVVHGFTGESSWMVLFTAVHLAKAGFAIAAVNHQGHGFSEGLQGHIPNIGPVLDDCEATAAARVARMARSVGFDKHFLVALEQGVECSLEVEWSEALPNTP